MPQFTMIEVDDSQLTAEDHAFIQQWAEALGVSVPVLLGRILLAALEGGHYIEKQPRD
jgi:hypothetical protein